MTARILASWLAPTLLAALGLGPAADDPEAASSSAPPGSEAAAEPEGGKRPGAPQAGAEIEAEAETETERPDNAAASEQVVDVILPAGVRVIAAKDASLPVAAVVLAIEVGTRDDPGQLPGLVHALAYHLQQGNRELAPGEAIATAHDVGGLAAMAVGPAQVRFESLVPISQLDEQLRVEALRLRAPNIGRELWLKSLSYARNDEGVKLVVPREAAAAAWADEGLKHDGRRVDQALGDMLDQALGAQLSRLFDYRLATLVVVGPDDPQALLARVEPLFADLQARPRRVIPEPAPPAPGGESGAPKVVRLPRQKGDSMVWAVPGEPAARAWAQVLCGTLNRQQRAPDEAAKARLRCTYADDPRRPLLVVRAIGFDPALGPEPLIAARLARITGAEAEPELAALIEEQRARIVGDLEFDLRAPLDLASYLASAATRREPSTAGLPLRSRDVVLGLPLLASDEHSQNSDDDGDLASAAAGLAATVPELLDTRRAVLLLAPDQKVPPPVHVGPSDAGPGGTPEAPDAQAGEQAEPANTQPGKDQPGDAPSGKDQPDNDQPDNDQPATPEEGS